jgi:hypothetical protein
MYRLALILIVIPLFVCSVNAQVPPPKVTSFLNQFYSGWKQAPGICENRKWFLTGDFDGDGLKDYLVRVKTGKSAKSSRLNLVAFFNADGGNYRAQQILDESFKGELLRSSFSVIKKGTRIQLGEGDGPTVTLENDAASQYICQTDAIKTLIFKEGKWKNIYDQ